MIDTDKKAKIEEEKEKVRKRVRVSVDPENYEYYAEKKPVDFYDTDVAQSVGIYVRVSTDDIRQTTSYELQQKYYESYVRSRPNWKLYKIYADQGISGTSLQHRDAFNQMIADARAGKINLIITKSVSRFARNVLITIGMVRDLSTLHPPVGVFFESEAIFSLNEESQLALSFLASVAEEESHTRSRSMETSLRMRLDNGIPLTPKLLGYTHDEDGNLIINPDEAPTVKLAFFMYLFGYSTQQIADTFISLGRKSYLGNIKWTSNGIVDILRNERHCGDVLTRKTFTESFLSHRVLKNRGERPQSRYRNHHDAIVSRDDFIAVQNMLDNSKYGNKSILPELRVIDSGVFKGFVVVNPRWAGFHEGEYFNAAKSVYDPSELEGLAEPEYRFEVQPGDFDLRGFECVRAELYDIPGRAFVSVFEKRLTFSTGCAKKLREKNCVELLINPITQKLAIRPTDPSNRCSVTISKLTEGHWHPRAVSSAAFSKTLFGLFGWNTQNRYRIIGSWLEQDGETAFVFDAEDAEAYLDPMVFSDLEEYTDDTAAEQPLATNKTRIRAFPADWTTSFGKEYYLHEQELSVLEGRNSAERKLWLQGNLFETGKHLNVTGYEVLRSYIRQELSALQMEVNVSG